jgi:hypothetical protein
MVSASLDPRARTQPRPRTTDSASPDRRARTQPRPRKTVSASPDPRARTRPRPRRSLRLARPRARTDHVTGGPSLPYPYLAQARGTRPASHLARPGKQVMMAPHVLHDNGGSQPLTEAGRRQQGSDSSNSCTYAYKRKVQGSRTRRLAARENRLADSLSLSLSPTRTLVTPYCKRTRLGRRTTRRPRVSPLLSFPPLCSVSRRPI